MITDNKLKKIAINLSSDFENVNTPTDVYASVMELAKQQKEYFINYIGLMNLIKLTIYIWSYKKTQDFRFAESIFKKMEFVTFLSHEEEYYLESCDTCDGDGNTPCDECDNRGTVTCDECDGEGEQECSSCDGSGEVEDEEGDMVKCDECNGRGVVDCDTCDGEGEVNCENCNGNGYETCYTCAGDGEVESNDYVYSLTYLVTWNSDILRFIENSGDDDRGGLMDTDELINYEDDYILCFVDSDNHAEFRDWVKPYVFWAIDETDEPKLYMNGQRIMWDISYRKLRTFEI